MLFSTLPGVLLGPMGGTFADRFSRKKIVVYSDLIQGILVFSLAALMFFLLDVVVRRWAALARFFTRETRERMFPVIPPGR